MHIMSVRQTSRYVYDHDFLVYVDAWRDGGRTWPFGGRISCAGAVISVPFMYTRMKSRVK